MSEIAISEPLIARSAASAAWRLRDLRAYALLAPSLVFLATFTYWPVAHQVAFDLDPAHEGALVFEPPAIRLHLYTPQSGIVSHTVYVERFAGPFPFVLDADYPGHAG